MTPSLPCNNSALVLTTEIFTRSAWGAPTVGISAFTQASDTTPPSSNLSSAEPHSSESLASRCSRFRRCRHGLRPTTASFRTSMSKSTGEKYRTGISRLPSTRTPTHTSAKKPSTCRPRLHWTKSLWRSLLEN